MEAKLLVPVREGGPAVCLMRSWSLKRLFGVSGVVDLEEMDTVWEVIEAFRLRIDPVAGRGIVLPVLEFFCTTLRLVLLGLPSTSCDVFKKLRNCGKPTKLPEFPDSLELSKDINCTNISILCGSLTSLIFKIMSNWSLFMNSRTSLICFLILSSI